MSKSRLSQQMKKLVREYYQSGKSKKDFAMKEMSKARILNKRSVKSVMNERQILTSLHNPFLVNMYYAFQDRENLYLVMDLLNGGDLRYHICRQRRFNEETTSKFLFIRSCVILNHVYLIYALINYNLFNIGFFVACLVSGLEYCHEK